MRHLTVITVQLKQICTVVIKHVSIDSGGYVSIEPLYLVCPPCGFYYYCHHCRVCYGTAWLLKRFGSFSISASSVRLDPQRPNRVSAIAFALLSVTAIVRSWQNIGPDWLSTSSFHLLTISPPLSLSPGPLFTAALEIIIMITQPPQLFSASSPGQRGSQLSWLYINRRSRLPLIPHALSPPPSIHQPHCLIPVGIHRDRH